MKNSNRLVYVCLTLCLGLLFNHSAAAALRVFSCEPEWKSLVDELGGERVQSYAATTAYQDPHHIEARPSLIARLRRADLLVCTGAELEIGWLPQLQRQAGNPHVLPGSPGYFAAATFVNKLEVPTDIDRSHGDIHAGGNPHVHLDPRRLATIAAALHQRLAQLDPEGRVYYRQRYDDFDGRWRHAMARWRREATPLKGIRVVVHHRDWVYLFDWLGVEIVGALEPRPGLPVTAGHLVRLKKSLQAFPAQAIVHTAYQSPRAAERFAAMSGLPVVELPYTVGGGEGVTDLFALFDITLQRLLAVRR